MKRLLFTAALLIALFPPLLKAQENLMVNGGFEDGNFTGWLTGGPVSIDTTAGQQSSGTASALLAGSVMDEGNLEQFVATVPGTAYVFQYDYIAGDGELYASIYGSTTLLNIASSSPPNTFATETQVFTANSGTTTDRVFGIIYMHCG